MQVGFAAGTLLVGASGALGISVNEMSKGTSHQYQERRFETSARIDITDEEKNLILQQIPKNVDDAYMITTALGFIGLVSGAGLSGVALGMASDEGSKKYLDTKREATNQA